MRIRLARKIKKRPHRYTSGAVRAALIRLGWKLFTWRMPTTITMEEEE